MTYDRADDQEPDDYLHDFHKIRTIFSNFAVDLDVAQKLETDVQVKDGAHANWTEEANKQSLSSLLDLMDLFMHGKDDGRPSEQQDQDAQRNKPVDGDDW